MGPSLGLRFRYRTLIGGLAGAVICVVWFVIIDAVAGFDVLESSSTEFTFRSRSLLLVGLMVLGSVLGFLLAKYWSDRPFPEAIRQICIGITIGVLLSSVVATTVSDGYALPHADIVRQRFLRIGVPAGAVLGALVGYFCWASTRRDTRN